MADLRGLVRHVLIYGSGVWAGKAIGFIMLPVYTRALTPADYGVLELVSRTMDIVGMVFGLGLASALFRFYADGRSDEERDRIINTAVVFAGSVGAAVAIALVVAAEPVSRLIFSSEAYSSYLRLGLAASGIEICTMVPMALLRVHERSGLFTSVNLSRLLLALGLNIYLVVFRRMGVAGVLVSGLISVTLVLLFLFALTRRYWKPRLDTVVLRGMLAYSLPLVPSTLAMFVLNFGDRYFLSSCCSLQVLGIYSLGYKLCMLMPGLVMEPVGLAWSAAMFTVAARPDANRVYNRFFSGFMFCAAFFSLGLAAVSHDLLKVMAGPEFVEAYRIVPVVLLGFMAWAAANVFETGLFVQKRTGRRALCNFFAAAVAMVAYAVLIPRYQAMGAAWATVCCFAAMAVSTYVSANRVYPVSYNLRRIVHLALAGAALYALTQLLPGEGRVVPALLRLLIVSSYPVALYVTGYFAPEDVSAARRAAVAFAVALRNGRDGRNGSKVGAAVESA